MLTNTTLITYLPRGRTYFVLHHNVDIKTEDNQWLKGCVYQDLDTKQVYVRAYCLFCNDNWKLS